MLRWMKLDPRAKAPSRAHAGDAGLDLYALEDVIIRVGEVTKVRTGIAMASDCVILLWEDRKSVV